MKNEESNEQIKVVAWCKVNKILCFSVPNGSHLSGSPRKRATQIHFLKKEGLHVGASDLIVMLDKKILFIEMKKCKKLLKNGSLSSAGISYSQFQVDFLEEVGEYSYAVSKLCYGSKEAIEYIKKHRDI